METARRLKEKADEFIRTLQKAGISAQTGTIHQFQMKIDVEKGGVANLWYSPKKDSFSLTLNEMRDSSLAGRLQDLWQGSPSSRKSEKEDLEGYHVYTDGSHKNGSIRYAFIVVKDGKQVHSEHGDMEEDEHAGHLNVAGEVQAVIESCRWMAKHKIQEFSIHFDYNGLEKWAKNEWKANTGLTRGYKDFFSTYPGRITWVKVKGHSGNRFNELVDKLAGKHA